ncbi:MAG: hypothetical protein CXT73_00245 [Methanobacteriota archaeon]|jgi:hypothetical protein|nr:MAG: hypothetical protein CXT73_00245 [Euryarchaeota archaeon]
MARTLEEIQKNNLAEYKRLFGEELVIGDFIDNPIQKTNAIVELYKGDYITADGEGNIEWKDGHETTAEEKKKIDDRFVELWKEWSANQYQRDRARAYPDWGTQLDKIYHDGIDKWKAEMVDPVKNAIPKP